MVQHCFCRMSDICCFSMYGSLYLKGEGERGKETATEREEKEQRERERKIGRF